MKQRCINATLTVVLALTSLLVLTPLPRASTAAPRLERQPLESLTVLNTAETAERGAPLSAFSAPSAASAVQSPGTTTRVSAALRSAPVMFIENVGQFAEGARFQVRGGMGTMWLAEDAIWVTVLENPSSPQPPSPNLGEGGAFLPSPKFERGAGGEGQPRKGVNLRLIFPGANPHPCLEPFDRLDTHVSYFIGNDPAKWRADVPVWGGVRYKDLYPGIDLEVTGENGRLVQRLVARSGANLNAVRLRVEGADAIDLLPSPDIGRGAGGEGLRLTTAVGEFTLPLLQAVSADGSSLPHAGKRPEVQANEVTAPFSSAPLLPSPSAQTAGASDLLYATFLGGGGSSSIVIDGSGVAYVVGWSYSSDFPTTPGAFDTTYNGSWDAFVVKLNAAGSALAYATFLGGSSDDEGWGIAVDGSGAAYVTGITNSSDFPATLGAFDTTYNGSWDAFVVKLNAAGSALAYATFLGGGSSDDGYGIAIDGSGVAYVVGWTYSSDFPTTPGAFDTTYNGSWDTFVVKLNAAGSALTYATFLGGGGNDYGYAIAVDGSGATYVTGMTNSSDFPATLGAFDTSLNGAYDTFVVKLTPGGSTLACATFLGGRNDDYGYAIAVDGAGSAYVAGGTWSPDFPATQGAFDTSYNGGLGDSFVVKLTPSGSALAYATFLGGSGPDWGNTICIDGGGAAYVAGRTTSCDFPTTPGAFDTSYNSGSADAFVVKLDATGSALFYATFLGGRDEDEACDLVVDNTGAAYVAGYTQSADFPTTPGVFDASYNGGPDAFVVKLALVGGPWPTPSPTPTPRYTPTPYPTPTNIYQEDNPAVVLTGSWIRLTDNRASGDGYAVSDIPGDTVQFTFSGDSIVLYRKVDTDGGRAEASIDGSFYGTLEFYFIEQRWQIPAIIDNLGSGSHTLTLQVSGSTHPDSTSRKVYIDAFAVPSPYTPTIAQRQALERVNWYRQTAGIPLVKASGAINLSAQAHAEYIRTNGWDDIHGEQTCKPGFVGQSSSERAAYFGYSGSVGEGIHWLGNTIPAIDEIMATVYHRSLPMNYGLTEMGFGLNVDRYPNDVLDMAYRQSTQPATRFLFTYPANGQVDVPHLWRDVEVPDPLPGAPKPVGYPASLYIVQPAVASVQMNRSELSPWLAPQAMYSTQLTATTAELRDPNGQSVPIYLIESGVIEKGGVFVIAREPLALQTTYTVHIAGTDSRGVAFDHTWSFTTEPAARISNVWVYANTCGAEIVWNTAGEATTWLEYGLSPAYDRQVPGEDAPDTFGFLLPTHKAVLPDLIPNTTYHYRIVSQDAQGNTRMTEDSTFPTLSLAGDLDGDNDVDVADIVAVASRWRTSCANPDPDNDLTTPSYDPIYDMDGDCDIDIVDIMLVVVHWGETCG